jgi:hypothetical protein
MSTNLLFPQRSTAFMRLIFPRSVRRRNVPLAVSSMRDALPRGQHIRSSWVAAPGKPTRLTDSASRGLTRLIGKPGVVPGQYLGPLL